MEHILHKMDREPTKEIINKFARNPNIYEVYRYTNKPDEIYVTVLNDGIISGLAVAICYDGGLAIIKEIYTKNNVVTKEGCGYCYAGNFTYDNISNLLNIYINEGRGANIKNKKMYDVLRNRERYNTMKSARK